MPDYKAQTKVVSTWQRCYRITIENPYAATPSIRFDEEVMTVVDNETSSSVVGRFVRDFVDPENTFSLYDPQTGEKTGSTMTHGEVYAVLWSLYMSLADERDAQI